MSKSQIDRAEIISYLKTLKGRQSDYGLHQVPTTAHLAPSVSDLVRTVDFFIGVFDTPVGRVDEEHGRWCDLRFGPFQLVPHEGESAATSGGSLVDGSVSPIPHVGLLFYEQAPFREVLARVEQHPEAQWYNGVAPHRRWQGMLGEQETGFLQVPNENLWIELKWFIHGQEATFAPELDVPVSG